MRTIGVRAWCVVAAVALPGILGGQGRRNALPPVSDSATVLHEVAHLKVIHRRNGASEVVAVRLYLLGGTRQLTEKTAGMEVLLLRAAQLDAWRAMARTGSRPILEVTPDWTVIGFVGLRKDLDSAWAGFARQLAPLPVSDAALERARGELAAMARRRYTQPDLRVQVGARRVAFRGHPYALDPNGTPESLASLSRADLEAYREREFTTSRMLLVVVGAIEGGMLDSLVTAAFGSLPTGQYRWTLPPRVPGGSSRWLVEHQDVPTNYILGYFGGPPPSDRDYFAFRVAVHLLSGRLGWELRVDRALSYASYAPFHDYAVPVGGVYATTSKPYDALLAIQATLLEMEYEVSKDLWWDSLKSIVLDELMQRATNDGQAEALAHAYLLFGDPGAADEVVRRLRMVTPEAVAFIGRNYMQSISYAYMGDTTLMRGRWGK